MRFSNELKDPYDYFRNIDELFLEYKKSEFYKSQFITTNADANYILDEYGNALFKFDLELEFFPKSYDSYINKSDYSFYLAVPIIEALDGQRIVDKQEIKILSVGIDESNKVKFASEKPKTYRTHIDNAKLVHLVMDVIEIKLSVDRSLIINSNAKDAKQKFFLKISFQVSNFAIKSHKSFSILRYFGKKSFDILWYFGFVNESPPGIQRTAKIVIEHPPRGHLETEPDKRFELKNEIRYAKHGRKFICGLHVNSSVANNDIKSSLHCFFYYSYIPEWGIILLSIIGYHLLVATFELFRHTYTNENHIKITFKGFLEWIVKGSYIEFVLWFMLLFVFTLIFARWLTDKLKKNCA